MAKKRFILRVRNPDGTWFWLNPDQPMPAGAAKRWKVVNRCDGLATQVWPEAEALEVIAKEKAVQPQEETR